MERALYAMLLIFVIATVVFILLMRQLRQRDQNRPKRGGMLSDADLKLIRDCAREYGASEIILFGSFLRDHQAVHDIDLGVRGVESDWFFAFYGELLMQLGKPVDLVDLSQPSQLTA